MSNTMAEGPLAFLYSSKAWILLFVMLDEGLELQTIIGQPF